MNRVQRGLEAKKLATREAALTYRIAALLLEYPHQDFHDMLSVVEHALADLPDARAQMVASTVEALRTQDVPDLERQFVETFDMHRKRSLYLTYFAHGDTRNRGVVLVQFKQAYRAAGVELPEDELPDFLPAVLEFAAVNDLATGIGLLLGHRPGLEVLRRSLAEIDSPWHGAVAAVCDTLPPLEGEEDIAVRNLIAQGPPDEEVGLEGFGVSADMAMQTGVRR